MDKRKKPYRITRERLLAAKKRIDAIPDRGMEFKEFVSLLQKHFEEISKETTHLFEVNVDKDELWELYLNSFPSGTNEVFRERREYDCSACRQFIKNVGNIVAIKNNKLKTIWDFETNDDKFQPVINALSEYVKQGHIDGIWLSNVSRIGVEKNFELSENEKVATWHHLHLNLPERFVNKTKKSLGNIQGSFRDTRNVFKRSLDEITKDSILTVLELISQNSLYKGEEWKFALNEFLKYKKEYDKVEEKELFAWEQSLKTGEVVGKIKNHSMGTLLINISEGMDLDLAVKKYEEIVAPNNYKRPKPIYTKKMLEDAQKTIEELGYMSSLGRRHATLDDISINNILFSNRDSAKRMSGNVFEEMLEEVAVNSRQFSRVEEVSVDKFVTDILPAVKELEVFLENKHSSSMVSLIAPKDKEAQTMFKWDNGFSWAYSGNMTDSMIKEQVKMAGGNVEGILRFSICWNDTEFNPNDFDAHCLEPNGNEIYFGKSHSSYTEGKLDVDIISPKKDVPAVENITWASESKMEKGAYSFFVHNYSNRGGRAGFKAEVEFDGNIYSFEYNKELKHGESVEVAEVYFDGDNFTIEEKLPSSVSSREIWNLKTNQFHPVSVMMYSPNYWDQQQGIGHRHYFFMLKGCINPENPNSFYNEFLKEDLMKHRKVFEALGSKLKVEDSEDQLSGIGFSSTKRNEVIVRVKGNIDRVLKIKF